MSRKEDLVKIVDAAEENVKVILFPIIDDICYIEQQLLELRKLPLIKVHTKDTSIQKATPAGKLYKELLQQYNNCIKLICGLIVKGDDSEGNSPFRDWVRKTKDIF